jgi:hypothetical protein
MKCISTAILVVVTAMLFFQGPMANAQVDEAMKSNWDNAGKLYSLILDAVSAGKTEEVAKLTGEFRDNLDYVQEKLERVGQRLHEKDRNWTWSSKKDYAVKKVRETKVAAGTLSSTIQRSGVNSASSELSNFKGQWKECVESMNDLRKEYFAHGKELNEIMKAFREDCRDCS